MIPSREEALAELELANTMNPGPWREHSLNVAKAAECIAAKCGLDSERAYITGLLHDIGRRYGVSRMRHTIDGYDFCMSKAWDEVARCCLTHSFPVQDIESDITEKDIRPDQYDFIKNYLETVVYDDYDKLIILCDALATAQGLCILEIRFVDVTRRYGAHPSTVPRWNNTIAIKEYFDSLAGCSIYRLLPGVEKCIFS